MSKLTKAVAGFVGTLGSGLVTANVDSGVSANEWYTIIGGALVVAAGVYYVPNTPTK